MDQLVEGGPVIFFKILGTQVGSHVQGDEVGAKRRRLDGRAFFDGQGQNGVAGCQDFFGTAFDVHGNAFKASENVGQKVEGGGAAAAGAGRRCKKAVFVNELCVEPCVKIGVFKIGLCGFGKGQRAADRVSIQHRKIFSIRQS